MEKQIVPIFLTAIAIPITHFATALLEKRAKRRVSRWAAEGNSEKLKKALPSSTFGRHFDAQDESGMTPLMHAAQGGHAEVVTLLLDKGAGVNTKSNSGWTAHLLAESNGHREVADLLREKQRTTQEGNPSEHQALAQYKRLQKYLILTFAALFVFGLLSLMFLLNDNVFLYIFGSFYASILFLVLNDYCSDKSRRLRILLYLPLGLLAWFLPFILNSAAADSPGEAFQDICFRFYFLTFLAISIAQGLSLFLQLETESLLFGKPRQSLAWSCVRAVAGTILVCVILAGCLFAAIAVQKIFFVRCKTAGHVTLSMLLPAAVVMNVILGVLNSFTYQVNARKPGRENVSHG